MLSIRRLDRSTGQAVPHRVEATCAVPFRGPPISTWYADVVGTSPTGFGADVGNETATD